MISCSLSAFSLIYSIFTIISEIILLLVSILFYFYQFYYYMDNQLCWIDIIYQSSYLSAILVYQYEWYYQNRYWYQYSFQIPVSKWNMVSISIVLQQSCIHSIQGLNSTRSARIGETSIHSFVFIQILVIDLDWTSSNEPGRSTVWRFGISIHDSIIQYQTRKSYWTRIFETISTRSDGC